jgi:anthranilate synthase/phosphoribosyltransferase
MILIIDNYDSFTFNLYQALKIFDIPLKVVRNDQITLAGIKSLNPKGIVLSPGPGRPENAGICVDLIQKFAGIFPILGVCLGHQALAQAFGGQILSADTIYHGKKSTIFHNGRNLFRKMCLPFEAGRYHSLVVDKETLPEDFEIQAETTEGTIMAIRHKKYPLFGTQFHPESILTPHGSIFLKNFISVCHEYTRADKFITQIKNRIDLSEGQVEKICDCLLDPTISSAKKSDLLLSLKNKGESPLEVAAFIKAFKKRMVSISINQPILDIAGMGGDGLNTVNLSTGAALLAASCGAYVAKHGNRAITSLCGSADVLEALDIPIDLPCEKLIHTIQTHGFGFCFAPLFHPAFKALHSVRQAIGKSTILNLLGPFLNPANAKHFVLGVANKNLLPHFSEILVHLKVEKSVVVHSQNMDEMSTAGITEVAEVCGKKIRYYTIYPKDLGLTRCAVSDLQGGPPVKNAQMLNKAFQGEESPVADSLVLNAGMALYIYGLAKNVKEGVALSQEKLKNQAAITLIKKLKGTS